VQFPFIPTPVASLVLVFVRQSVSSFCHLAVYLCRYQTSAGLWISETTIDNNNASLWMYVQPTGTVFEWARNMVANRLSSSGAAWAATYSRFNSGTYNNMWHVVDLKLFVPGKPLAADLLWVLEQMPGPYIAKSDHTPLLNSMGYWASYNRVHNPLLFAVSNQTALVAAYGDHYSFNATSRGVIFAREHASVVDEASLAALMRRNKFESDDVGTQGCTGGYRSASNAIAERGDLTSPDATCLDPLVYQNEVRRGVCVCVCVCVCACVFARARERVG
jgi:hypothetical protein